MVDQNHLKALGARKLISKRFQGDEHQYSSTIFLLIEVPHYQDPSKTKRTNYLDYLIGTKFCSSHSPYSNFFCK